VTDAYESIVERLAAVEEELRDLAYERLRDGEESDEKKLNQARRAVAKAITVLAPREVFDDA
jgi:ribosomal protein L29